MERDVNHERHTEVGKFRTILPQIFASVVKNFLLIDYGLSVAFATIVIPVLTNSGDSNEVIHITPTEASWLGSIMFVFEPIGSLMSGWITEPIGRKRAMFFVNIPHLVAWTMFYYSTTLGEMWIAFALLGFGIGLMESPIVTYVGEISQASIRGILIGISGVAVSIGVFIIFLLGSILVWRDVAFYCLFIPLSTMTLICFIPETPMWLMSKNRMEDARKSLQWLRGWVSPAAVAKEFAEIQRYTEFSKSCADCSKFDQKCPHPPPSFVQGLRELLRKRTLKPFVIVCMAYVFSQFSGYYSVRPYIVLIFKVYGIPIDPNWATAYLGVSGILGTLTCISLIKLCGKRGLFISGISILCICNFGLSIYGFMTLPAGITSFSAPPQTDSANWNIFVLSVCVLMAFITSFGATSVPSMLLSELFPLKTRCAASGVSGAITYLTLFVANKTFVDIEAVLSLPGAFAFYGAICSIGVVISYLILPETERRTLEDIEYHFAKNDLSFFARHIPINVRGDDRIKMETTA